MTKGKKATFGLQINVFGRKEETNRMYIYFNGDNKTIDFQKITLFQAIFAFHKGWKNSGFHSTDFKAPVINECQ